MLSSFMSIVQVSQNCIECEVFWSALLSTQYRLGNSLSGTEIVLVVSSDGPNHSVEYYPSI
ncbi:hypothetical protein JCM7447_07950 [Corynebacterium amycolatum]